MIVTKKILNIASIKIPEYLLLILSFFPVLTIRSISKIILLFFISSILLNLNKLKYSFKKTGIRPLLVATFFYLFLIISFVYTPDKIRGLKILIRQLSFLLIPLILIYVINLTPKKVKQICIIFVFSNILVIFYFGFKLNLVEKFLSHPLTFFNTPFFLKINQKDYKDWHSTYIAFNNLISVLLLLRYVFMTKKMIKKISAVLLIMLFMFFFIILNSRTIFMITLFVVPLYLVMELKNLKSKIGVILVTVIVGATLINISNSNKLGRFFVKPVSYYISNHNLKEILGVRYEIHECAKELVVKKPLLGYGIGYAEELLSAYCYEVKNFKSKILSLSYNSHSTYYFLLLSSGVGSFITLIFYMLISIKNSVRSKDVLGAVIIIVFILAFLTENYFVRLNGVVLFSFINAYLYVKNKKYYNIYDKKNI